MDHSIFGSLMDVNGDITEDSHCSQEEVYIDERRSNYVPESSVEEGYGSDFYPLAINLDVASANASGTQVANAKPKNAGNKKKVAGKSKELRFRCTQCGYRTWKKSNFQRHLGTHNKKLYKCTLCPFSGKHADDLQKHIICHKKKEPRITTTVNKHVIEIKDNIKSIRAWSHIIGSRDIKREPPILANVKVKEEPKLSNVKLKLEPNVSNVKLKEETKLSNVKIVPKVYTPPVEVYLDEQSSNSCMPESSVEDGYDSDFYPLTVNIDITTPHEAYNSPAPVSLSEIKSIPELVRKAKESTAKINRDLKFSCPYCEYRTWKTSNFQRHLSTHAIERPHKCHLCNYTGKHPENLKKHMLCHNKDLTIVPIQPVRESKDKDLMIKTLINNDCSLKRFSCLQCDFKTTRSSVLNRHQYVVHNDCRPYACDLCPYRSKQRDSLKKHMMAHTDERPFECEICHHRCRQKGDLKRHKLLHTGERPFACPHCPYRSNRTQLLKRHITRRHTLPEISSEITVTKTSVDYAEFTGGHYLAEMF